jgi:hypothetical protein
MALPVSPATTLKSSASAIGCPSAARSRGRARARTCTKGSATLVPEGAPSRRLHRRYRCFDERWPVGHRPQGRLPEALKPRRIEINTSNQTPIGQRAVDHQAAQAYPHAMVRVHGQLLRRPETLVYRRTVCLQPLGCSCRDSCLYLSLFRRGALFELLVDRPN